MGRLGLGDAESDPWVLATPPEGVEEKDYRAGTG